MLPFRIQPSAAKVGWYWPGALAWRLALVAVLAMALSASLSAWLVTRAAAQEAMRRVVSQQIDEVEVVARLLASKIEQSQKVLRTVASSITPGILETPSALEWVLQQGLPAVQFFDGIQVARDNGELLLNLRAGQLMKSSEIDDGERDALRRTLVHGKPLISELITGQNGDARIMFTMPLHREGSKVRGVVAGSLRLQSQGLLPASLIAPARDGSRLVVFTSEGTILSHSDPQRILGKVSDEPGLATVFQSWRESAQPVMGRGSTHELAQHLVSMAGMPLPQWFVARVSDSQALLEPLDGAQRNAWWLAALSTLVSMGGVMLVMLWLTQPLAHLAHSARAQRLMRQGSASDGVQKIRWPRTQGEVALITRILRGMGRQRQQQQRSKKRLVKQFQTVLDCAPTGIAVSRDGILSAIGRPLEMALGYAPTELVGQRVQRLFADAETFQNVKAQVNGALLAHGSFDGDVCLVRKEGSAVWMHVRGLRVARTDMDDSGGGEGIVWMVEDISATRAEREQPSWRHEHDALTQLYNRVACEARLEQWLHTRTEQASNRKAAGLAFVEPGPLSEGVLLFMDLDHFTLINELAGHDAGDSVLCHIARLIESQVHKIGWSARLGGDEFVVVLPRCTLARGYELAEQLRASIAVWEPHYRGRSFTLGVSIGLVVLDAGWNDVQSLLNEADMACYEAKRAGRNRVEVRPAASALAPAALRIL